MARLDEPALRRPDFDDKGRKVVLGDGQEWCFPAATIRVMPDEDEQGKDVMRHLPWHRGGLDRELNILFGIENADPLEEIESRVRLARTLLRRNYDLPKGAIAVLLSYTPGDAASEAMWHAIELAILDRDPPGQPGTEDEDGLDPKEPTAPGSN